MQIEVSCYPARCRPMWLVVRCSATRKGQCLGPSRTVALIVATIVELLHFLMVSGVSQGASVFLRASGMVIGAATYPLRRHLAAIDLNRVGLPAALILMGLNIGALAYVAGWFRSQKIGITAGIARLTDIVWLPFLSVLFALSVDDVQRDGPRRLVRTLRCRVLARIGPS